MRPMFDPKGRASAPRSQRLAAISAIALVVASWALLGSFAGETGHRMQSLAWVFGPAPVTDVDTF